MAKPISRQTLRIYVRPEQYHLHELARVLFGASIGLTDKGVAG